MDPKLFKPFVDQYLEYVPKSDIYKMKPQTCKCEVCGNLCVDRRIEAQVMAYGKKTQHVIHKCTACYQILYRGAISPFQVKTFRPINSAPRGRPRKNPLVAISVKRSPGRPPQNQSSRQEVLVDTDEIRITQYHHDSTPVEIENNK